MESRPCLAFPPTLRLAFVLGTIFSSAARADVVKIVNKTDAVLYVVAGDGKCSSKPALSKTLSIDPSTTGSVTTQSADKALCYVAARIKDVLRAPLYCDTVISPATVTIDDSTAPCKGGSAKPAARQAAAARAPARPPRLAIQPLMRTKNRLVTTGGGTVHIEEGTTLEYSLAVWNDPLTPPQTEAHCTQTWSGDWPWGGGWSTCVGWELDCSWMQDELVLVIRATDQNGMPYDYATLKGIVDNCLQDAVIAGTLAGIIETFATGGVGLGAAEQTFQDVFLACLANAATDLVVNGVSIEERSHWTSWGPCT